MIKLQAQFLDYHIETIKLENANEFTSQTFTNYGMTVRINVEHLVAHTHTQNGLAESLIKLTSSINSLTTTSENQIANFLPGDMLLCML